MFRSLKQSTEPQVQITINGKEFSVPAGSSVWGALALANEAETRKSPVSEEPRSAYCAMGVCFECLVEIDGVSNQQACLIKVKEGMDIRRQEVTQTTVAEGIADGYFDLPEFINAAEVPSNVQ